jgi:hypothetical protein
MVERVALEDLFALDRRVRAVAAELEASAKAVARGEDETPFEKPSRNELSTLATWRSIAERPVSALDEPLRAGLLRWMHAFLLARVAHARELTFAEARLAHDDVTPPYAPSLGLLALGVDDAARMLALDHVSRRVAPVLAEQAGLDELVAEAGRRSVGLVGAGPRAARAHGQGEARAFEGEAEAAGEILARTEGALDEAWARFRFTRDGVTERPKTLAFFDGLLARDAREGWPSRHLEAWLAESFREFLRMGRRPRAVRAPHLAGATSHLRLVGAFGAEVARASVPNGTPFALAHEPLAFRTRVAAVVFALAVVTEPFQRRVLGLTGVEASVQLRALRRAVLQHARVLAVSSETRRLGLRFGSRDHLEFAEASLRGFVDPRAAAALTARGDGFDFEVLLQGVVLASRAREALDDDWFRNPRAPEWFDEHLGALLGPYPRLANAPDAVRLLARLLGEHYA